MNRDDRIGVMLLNLGGPDSLEAVEPFLYNLFCDPDIIDIKFGWLFRKPLAKFISTRRTKHVAEIYRTLGGRSPLNELTREQADKLQESLAEQGPFKVYMAMRYWHPLTEEVLLQAVDEGVRRFVLLPLYPQFSKTTTGSSVNEWNRLLKKHRLQNTVETRLVPEYHQHPKYIASLVARIGEGLERFDASARDQVHLLFSAHGVPVTVIEAGDPYQEHVQGTVNAVMKAMEFSHPHHVSYQSKVGRARWLEPSTVDRVAQLGKQGIRHLLVVPVAFVSDHSETLYEIDIEIRKEAAEPAGIENFTLMPAINDHPSYIEALSELTVREARTWKSENVAMS
jgi:ferrochelatase